MINFYIFRHVIEGLRRQKRFKHECLIKTDTFCPSEHYSLNEYCVLFAEIAYKLIFDLSRQIKQAFSSKKIMHSIFNSRSLNKIFQKST